MAGLQFWENKLKESGEGLCRRGRGRSFHEMDKTEKARGQNSGESGARNLEAASIRSGAESRGGCVE